MIKKYGVYFGILFGILSNAGYAQCDTATIYSTTNANAVCFDTVSNVLKCYSNNYPDHSDSYNSPFTAVASDQEYFMCLYPDTAQYFTPLYEETITALGCTETYYFGVSVNGIRYNPNSSEYFQDSSGADVVDWHIEARYIFNNSFGNNGGHINSKGEYHYHDIPVDYFIDSLGIDGNSHSPIVGFAADGLPIYYKYVYQDAYSSTGGVTGLNSGYSLKNGTRPGDGFTAPDGPYTGLYYEDYEYSSTTLDSCNGRYGITPDYPNGTYYYVLTDNYPYIPRCFKGSVLDHSFRSGPPASCPSSNASSDCSTTPASAIVFGCTDPFSCNYDPTATVDDGSCSYDTLSLDTIETCNSYNWQSATYTISGTYYDTLSSASGCDSILGLVLTINNDVIGDTSMVSSCNSYTWQSTTYTSTGVYFDTLSTSSGCDSILTLDLTINNGVIGDTTEVSVCDSYTWQSTSYTTSGFYSDTLSSSNGCDSIISLDLTIGTEVLGDTSTISSCGDYSWQGITYTTSGIYKDTLSTSIGCDSIISLDLTIGNTVTGVTTTISSCDSYTWENTTYSSTGVYYDTINVSSGCDSINSLDLTI